MKAPQLILLWGHNVPLDHEPCVPDAVEPVTQKEGPNLQQVRGSESDVDSDWSGELRLVRDRQLWSFCVHFQIFVAYFIFFRVNGLVLKF